MKLSCLQENLAKGLETVSRIVPKKSIVSATKNIRLVAKDGQLELSATDMELSVSTRFSARIEKEGSAVIPGNFFTNYVGSLPPEKIDLELLTNDTLEIRGTRFNARVASRDTSSFPVIPELSNVVSVEVDAGELRQAITQVALAAATDNNRPVLTGVLCEFEEGKLTMASADGFRLAERHLSLAKPVVEKISAIVPARALNELNRLAADQQDPIQITIGSGHIIFHLKMAELMSVLIDGNYPNYRQLIPASHSSKVTVNTNELTKAIKMIFLFREEHLGVMKLIAKAGEMTVSSVRSDEGHGASGEAKLDCKTEGETKMAFKTDYLLDFLSAIKLPEVSLESTSPTAPGAFRSVGNDNYVYVVMPMFIVW